MQHYKRTLSFILTTLIVLFVSVFLLDQKVYAAPLINNNASITFDTIFNKQSEIEHSNDSLKLKTKEVETIINELDTISNKKENLSSSVVSLKDSITNLDDMFVHINKYASDSGGNNYAFGNCTYYVKNKRPDISNSLGNANTWYSTAQARGWNVGIKAKKGAVATSVDGWLGHVAYVEGVTLDGQWVKISEMNAPGFNVISSKTVHYSEFRYIYELD